MNKINPILKEVLRKINPSDEEFNYIDKYLKEFVSELEKKLKSNKINAMVFVGGSFAKKTIIKKGQYDIDVFVRFEERYKKEDISKITEKILNSTKKKLIKIHGSRDYFRIDVNSSFYIEIVPVLKVRNPKQAENITDLSYFHVSYIKKRLKTEKMLEEVRLAKAFCHANKCYGAESYINGFSGYSLELLVYHYKGFLNFIKAMTKIKEKEIIDIEKLYKNKYEISMNMNSAKMGSPVVVIDPTYKERNALAALNKETFNQFQEACRKFLKNPSLNDFEIKNVNLGLIKKNSQKSKSEFILINAETDRQEGDIAGSKLLKFYRHILEEIEKLYKISNKGFDYQGTKEAEYFFVVKKKERIIQSGPSIKDIENVKAFKKNHKTTFIKGNKIYAKEKNDKNIKEFIQKWKLKNSEKMKEMNIRKLDMVEF
jgi:tRNA CCA-adding enzyme